MLNEQVRREHFGGPGATFGFAVQQLPGLAQLQEVAHPADAVDVRGGRADRRPGRSRSQEANLDLPRLVPVNREDLGIQAGDGGLAHFKQ